MNIYQIKKQVLKLTFSKSTNDLQKNRPELVIGKDLRCNESWIDIYNTLKLVEDFSQDQEGKNIQENYQFKDLDFHSSLEDLVHNMGGLNQFMNDLDQSFEQIEAKTKISDEEIFVEE